MRKLKQREVQGVRDAILQTQGHRCALCMMTLPNKDAVLDHDHKTGSVRGVLCRNCNGIEGKVYNLANRAKRKYNVVWWINRLLAYWDVHDECNYGLMYPTHKTADEKRLKRNETARKKRAAAKQ